MAIVVLASAAAAAQTVGEVMEGVLNQEMMNNGSVQDYLLESRIAGITTMEYFERMDSVSVDINGDGQTVDYPVMRLVPIDEIVERQKGGGPLATMSPEELEAVAQRVELAGQQMEGALMAEWGKSDVGAGPGGLFAMMAAGPPPREDGTREIWLSANPRDMGTMYATMLRGAAQGKRERAAEDPKSEAEEHVSDIQFMAMLAEIVDCGPGSAGSVCLQADDVNFTQVQDGVVSTINSMHLEVDADRYVPVAMKVGATIEQDGQTRDIMIERFDDDYRAPSGCGKMYRPYRSVSRIGGMLTPEEQAEMQEAQAQLAEFEQQMASMPPSQREMMERMIGPQMEAMRNMASTGDMEIETHIVSVTCNKGLPNPDMMALKMMGDSASGSPISD
jgi:hypothetical protein